MTDRRINQVLEKLIEAKIICSLPDEVEQNCQIELVHETLIYDWPRCDDWLKEEQLRRDKRLRLTNDAEDWNRQNQSALLWSGEMLEAAKSYRGLSKIESAFLMESESFLQVSRLKEEERIKQIESLVEALDKAKGQEKALQERVKGLEFSLERSLLYKKRYRAYSVLMLMLSISTVIAFSLLLRMSRDGAPLYKQELSAQLDSQ